MATPALDNSRFDQELNGYLQIASIDPYSGAVAVIAATLECVLGDGINDEMSEQEYGTLSKLALLLCSQDKAVDISPRAG